jgi:hypothetical protein
MISPWKLLPTELLPLIVSYFPYQMMSQLCRTSNEMRNATSRSPTGSAHIIHLAVARFHWRWIPSPHPIPRRCYPRGSDRCTPLGNTREYQFVLYTLQFHNLWTGPPIPYSDYSCNQRRHPSGIYTGAM